MVASRLTYGFLKAALNGDLTSLKKLAPEIGDGGYDMITDLSGRNALHLATSAGNTQICEFLIENLKLDIDWRDNYPGLTALHHAVENGREEIVRLLLSKGAKLLPDSYSTVGTPLHSACFQNNKEFVKIFLDHRESVNSSSDFYSTPLMAAVLAKSYDCMEVLLKAGANPNFISKGKTALIEAAPGGDAKLIKYLLDAGASPDVTDIFGVTAIEHAAMLHNVNVAKALFAHTSPISTFPEWSFHGVMKHARSDEAKAQRYVRQKDVYEQSKIKGQEAFEKKDYVDAIHWYCQAMIAGPPNEIILSNRSLCLARLNEGLQALLDANDCLRLKPDFAYGHYAQGVANMVLDKYSKASEAFSKALQLDPDNEEIKQAHREAVKAESKYAGL